MARFRLVGTSGSELEIVELNEDVVTEGETITLPDGTTTVVFDVYDGEDGREGGVEATLVIDDEE